MTMTRLQNKELALLLQAFYQIDPTSEAMETLVNEQWQPFLNALPSDKERSFAITAYFELTNYNFSQLLIHLGQLSKEQLAEFKPLLASFQQLENDFRAVIRQKAYPPAIYDTAV